MSINKKNIIAVIITGATALVLGLLALLALYVSKDYNKAYGFPPPPVNGVMDMKGYSLVDNPKGVITTGEWEFFYNKWIVSDNLTDAEPDCILNLPEYWTGKKALDGTTMKSGAYASYRLTLINLDESGAFYIDSTYMLSFRFFVNGQLCNANGTMSKSSDNKINSPAVITPYSAKAGERLEIVLEISYNTFGGMDFAPWVFDMTNRKNDTGAGIIDFSSTLIPGIMLAFVLFSFAMSFNSKKRLASLTLPLFVLIALIQLLTTAETVFIYAHYLPFLRHPFVFKLCLVLFHILPATFLLHLLTQKYISLNKYELTAFSVLSMLMLILFFVFWATAYQYLTVLFLAIMYLYIFYKLTLSSLQKKQYALFHVFMMFPLLMLLSLIPLDLFGVIIMPLYPAFSWLLLLIATAYTGMSYKITRTNASRALRAVELENEIGRIKHTALQAQIKPHFIFNALSSIQALYEKDKKEGSTALSKFASHLRQNIDSDKNDMIPFSQEIKNIMNYVELENLRLDKKLTLLINIDFAQFEIPTLSLQPLVENAIKYADTQNKDDGHIRILSEKREGEIIIEVYDNGNGFDVDKIRTNATGIENCKERFKYLLNADLEINSVINKGTSVKIHIPTLEKEQ